MGNYHPQLLKKWLSICQIQCIWMKIWKLLMLLTISKIFMILMSNELLIALNICICIQIKNWTAFQREQGKVQLILVMSRSWLVCSWWTNRWGWTLGAWLYFADHYSKQTSKLLSYSRIAMLQVLMRPFSSTKEESSCMEIRLQV